MQRKIKQKGFLAFLSIKQPKLPHYSIIDEVKHIFVNKPFSIPIRIFFIIVTLSFVMLGISLRALPPLIPLYYSLPWGEEQLVRSNQLFPSFWIINQIVSYSPVFDKVGCNKGAYKGKY